MRAKPSVGKGLLVVVGYLVVVFLGWAVSGIDYDEIGDSVENVRSNVTVSVGLGAVFLVLVVSLLGWWRPAMREPRRAGHAWMWMVPGLLALGALGNLATTKWDRVDDLGPYLLFLGLGCVFVGFSEEMLTRGQLIVAARGSLHEVGVWLVSSIVFGLIHVPNVFFGQSLAKTVQQVVFAFVIGTSYYVTRRISGMLAVTMVLHALWDFSSFIQSESRDGLEASIPFGAFPMYIAAIAGLVAVWRILRADGDVVEPGGDQLAALAPAPA